MDKNIISMMNAMDLNEPADEKTIKEVENSIGFSLPVQYREFMLYSNGAEGELGENSYLVLWPIEDIIPLNEAYEVSRYTPGILYFGSDGGDAAYAFDARDEAKAIIEIPFISIHDEDAHKCADNFNDFIKILYED